MAGKLNPDDVEAALEVLRENNMRLNFCLSMLAAQNKERLKKSIEVQTNLSECLKPIQIGFTPKDDVQSEPEAQSERDVQSESEAQSELEDGSLEKGEEN